MTVHRGVHIFLSLAVGLAACSSPPGSDRVGTDAELLPDQALSFDLGSCDVTVTGARSLAYRTPGGALTFATDYWLTDVQMRELLEVEAREDEMIAEDDVAWFVDLGMSRDPRAFPMAIFCSSQEASVSLVPGSQSRYADVPFRPKAYEIAPVSRADDAIAGNFAALVALMENGESVTYAVMEPGTLEIEVFHRSRIDGAFAFQAARAEGGDVVQVTGRFSFRRPAPATDDEF